MEHTMAATFQLVIDCADPEPLARFWAAALRYEFEPPPDGASTPRPSGWQLSAPRSSASFTKRALITTGSR
jgi:hypothetical protein